MSYNTAEKKKEIFKEYGGSEANTGSVQSQVALYTFRINEITQHLKKHKKDYSSTRALLKMVGKRKRLLNYLAKKDVQAYRKLIEDLKLRK